LQLGKPSTGTTALKVITVKLYKHNINIYKVLLRSVGGLLGSLILLNCKFTAKCTSERI